MQYIAVPDKISIVVQAAHLYLPVTLPISPNMDSLTRLFDAVVCCLLLLLLLFIVPDADIVGGAYTNIICWL